jgi:hypothetical protein
LHQLEALVVMLADQKQELRVHQFSFIEMHSEFTIIDLESKLAEKD